MVGSNQIEDSSIPEQNRSVGDKHPPLPLLLLPEHIDEKELESLGGSERRPSKRTDRDRSMSEDPMSENLTPAGR
jgi:hypothetical protein